MTEPSTLPDTAPDAAPDAADDLNRSAVEAVQTVETGPAAGVGSGAVDDRSEVDSSGADDAFGAGSDDALGADADGADDADADAGAESNGASAGEDRPRSRRAPAHEQLVAEGDAAGDYLERLLDILDFDGDIDLDVEGERAVVSVIGDSADIDRLVGDRGEVLDALQELTRLAATAETGQRSRLMLDVAGFRAQRRVDLTELGASTATNVLETGEDVRLAPMNPFERKIVHDAIAVVDGVSSSSEGEEPRRRVVVSRDA